MRHLVTFPESGCSIVVGYGCSECNWRYVLSGINEVYSGAAFWNVQVFFERHECKRFKVGVAEPEQPPKSPYRSILQMNEE